MAWKADSLKNKNIESYGFIPGAGLTRAEVLAGACDLSSPDAVRQLDGLIANLLALRQLAVNVHGIRGALAQPPR